MKQTNIKETLNNSKFNTVIIITIVILLLITLVSFELSVTTFSRIASEQSKVLSQLENTNDDIKSTLAHRYDTIQMNTSQNVMELVETQLITARSNISKQLDADLESSISLLTQCLNVQTQLDAKLEHFISLQTQYTSTQTQTHCGPGLRHRLIYLNMSDLSQQYPFPGESTVYME